MTAISPKEHRLLLWAAVVVYAACHFYYVTAPPNGYHHWRESDTMSITANYYFEDMDFLKPRVNQRGNTSGITGTELPVYQYVPALLFHVFGFSHAIPRLLTLLAGCLGLWLFYRIVRRTSGTEPAAFSVIALAFAPLYFFYSFKIMPDIWMLTALLAAVDCYLTFLRRGLFRYWLASALLLTVSGSIKPISLAVYLPFLYLWWTEENRNPKALLRLVAYAVVTFGPVLGWFLHARSMNELYGTTAFYMGHRLGDFASLSKALFYKKLFAQWPWELWVGWHFVPVFIFGLVAGFRAGKIRLWLVWMLASYIMFALVSAHACSHDYYTLIIVPPIAAIAGIGLHRLYLAGRVWKLVAVVLIIIAPVSAFMRVISRFDETETFYRVRADVDEVIPPDALVMVRDNTNAIRLYQLNRKGWPLLREADLNTVRKYIALGAEYIILDEPMDDYLDSLDLYFETTPRFVGPLACYSLKK